MLVGSVVVHDQVHVEIGWNRLLDLAQEPQELLVVADGVMGHPLHVAQARQAHALGDGRVAFASTADQNDLGSLNDRTGKRTGTGYAQEPLNFRITEDQRRHWTTESHGGGAKTLLVIAVIFGTPH